MKTFAAQSLTRFNDGFGSFSLAQKVIAVVGSLAVLISAVMLVRWVAEPEYATLFSDLEPADANAIVEQLESAGTPYELTGDGTSVRVPRDEVYRTRIAMSGEGLPTAADGGYSLLDEQDLSTSQFQERTDFKRAMEGELSATIRAMNGVDSAIVHLALPEKEVFSDEQAPPTASVLVGTPRGDTLEAEQVQSIVHLVAASVDDMDPEKVTVADSSGRLLSADDGSGMGAFATSRDQYVRGVEQQYRQRIQAMLDQVVGAGNSTVQVSADVNFDKSTVESRSFTRPQGDLATSSRTESETYTGGTPDGGASGVVGPDGQMDTTAVEGADGSSYEKSSQTSDNAVDTTVEQRETAPGSVTGLHVAAVVEQAAAAQNNPRELQRMISSAVGIDQERGDTFRLSVLPFDTSAQEEAAAELQAQEEAAAAAARGDMFRNVAIGAGLLLALLLGWLLRRRRHKQRMAATSYVVEQLRTDARRNDELSLPATALSLEGAAPSPEQETHEELIKLVENQPEDVAALLRGWLVEKR